MQSAAGAQVLHLHSHLHSRSHRSQPLITNRTSSTTSSPPSSRSSSPPPSNTSTFYSDDLPEHKATNPSHQHHGHAKDTPSVLPSLRQELSSLSRSVQCGRPRKRRKTYSSRSSSLGRGLNIYRHWTTKSFEPSLAIDLPTNPTHTQSLWQSVMMGGTGSGRRAGASDQGRKKDPKGASAAEGKKRSRQEKTRESVSEQSDPPSESETPETGSTKRTQERASNARSKTTSNASSKRNNPRSKAFEQNILIPRSVIIDHEPIPMTAYAHFDVYEPPPPHMTQQEYYTNVRSVPKSTIWVETDNAFIKYVHESYSEMIQWKLCEAEFASYAKEELLKRNKPLDKSSRYFQAMRLVELVNKPGPKTPNWVPPPLTEAATATNAFAFDIRPDCTYWVSLQGTDQRLRYIIESIVHTICGNFTSPYFTIEFKKDDQDAEVALNQLAGASALALYNRFCLRQKRLLQENDWTTRRTRVLRHYGLTMQGEEYTVWCTRPTLNNDFTWAGCEMEKIGYGKCNRDHDIRELIYWINEIHCWGLTKHAPRVEKDIKWKIEARRKEKGGSRPSDIVDDSEDEPDSENETA